MPLDSRQNLRCKPFPCLHIGLKSIYPSSPPSMEGFFLHMPANPHNPAWRGGSGHLWIWKAPPGWAWRGLGLNGDWLPLLGGGGFRGRGFRGLFLRGTGGAGGGGGGGGYGSLELGQVDDLDERHGCAVGLALSELDDAAVSALAVLGGLSDDAEELCDDLGLGECGECLPAGVEG